MIKPNPAQKFTVGECKFCHGAIWTGMEDQRTYAPGGQQFHVESCPRRAAHFREQAAQNAEAYRQRRMHAEADARDEVMRARERMERRRERLSWRNRG